MDENPSAIPACGNLRRDALGTRRGAAPGRRRRAAGRCARAGIALHSAQHRGLQGLSAAGVETTAGSPRRRPRRGPHRPCSMTNVRLAADSSFTDRAWRADPGSGSRPRTRGPFDSPAGRPWTVAGAVDVGPGWLVRLAGWVKPSRKMLLNLRLRFFRRKNLARPKLARMLAWNPNQSFWPRTMVRTQRSYRAPARPCWHDEIPSDPLPSAPCDTRPDLETMEQCRRS